MRVAFLDRDGVINRDSGYLYKSDDFEFTEGCLEALKLFQEQGYSLIIVTNQSGIGRGYYTETDYKKLTYWYLNQLQQQGIEVMDVFHCPHTPNDGCDCRKPKPGMFYQAIKRYPTINFSESLMVGDKLSDLEAASAAGVGQLILVSEPQEQRT